MNDRQREHEEQMQQRAEGNSPADTDAAAVNEYRQVYHAIRQARIPETPHDFAMEMEAMSRDHAEQAVFEKWLLRVFLAVGTVALLLVCITIVGRNGMIFTTHFSNLPWTLITTAVLGGALAWFGDRWLGARRLDAWQSKER